MTSFEDCTHDCKHELRPTADEDVYACALCGCSGPVDDEGKPAEPKSADTDT